MHLFKAVVTGLVALASVASATELIPDLGEQIVKALAARQASFTISGVRNGGGIQPRLEVRQLLRNWDQFNLYLLGLQRMQNMDQRNPLSYFQIASIHGRPYNAWDGVRPIAGSENSGYCTHASHIFLTWHRPYLALFEQSLYANVLDVVNQFQGAQRDRYARAAATFRMPYYDAASNDGTDALPDVLTRPRLWVDTPVGRREIANPLYAYTFRPLRDLNARSAPFTAWTTTLRHPSSDASNAVSRNEIARQRINNARRGLRDRVFNLFRIYSDFNQFGNSAWYPDNTGRYDSVESVHDLSHVMIGGNGHMGFVDYSAFDPLFWLHHTNIDRYFAMWQVIYPNSYVQPRVQRMRTFTTRAGVTLDVNSPLTPFHNNANGGFWTSASARFTNTFSYNYPETRSGANADSVRRAINMLYGSGTTTTRRVKRDEYPMPTSTATFNGTTDYETPKTNSTLPKEHEYFVNIASQKHGLGGSYSIYVFLHEPKEDPASWPVQKNLVGTHCVFAASSESDSGPALRESRVKTAGVVPLDSVLHDEYEMGNLPSLEEKDVLPYLQQELHWRCALADDTPVKCEDVPDFEFTVASADVTPARSDSELPKRQGPVVEHKEVSAGQPGGPPMGGPTCYCP